MTVAEQLQHDPAERGFRILAEMLEEAAAARTLRVVEDEEGSDGD